MPTPQDYIKQAEKYGKRRQSREGLRNALQWGWQAGMQMRQMKGQEAQLEQEKQKEALNAQFNVFKLQMPFLTEEQVGKRAKELLDNTGKVYGIPIDTSSMEFGGQEKTLGNDIIKINDKIQKGGKGGITTLVELNAAFAQLRQKYPHRKLEAIDAAQRRAKEALQAFQTTEKQKIDTLLKIDKEYNIIGPTPEGTPQGMGLLPPGRTSGAEMGLRGREATPTERLPSGLLNIGGYQVKRRPPEVKPPTKPTGANKETIIQNYINKFKTPPGAMGAIKIRRPEERRNRLKGLFRTMELEKKNPNTKLSEDDRWRVIETVMTDLGIEIGLQHSVRAASMAEGVTIDQLISVIERYQTKKVR